MTIYYELVRLQDRGTVSDTQAYVIIAKRFRVPLSAVKRIAFEGASKNWPLPPLPSL
jgi:hypothetical protein